MSNRKEFVRGEKFKSFHEACDCMVLKPLFLVNSLYSICPCGKTIISKVKTRSGRKMKQHLCVKGYPVVKLVCGEKRKIFKVHRLVAEAYLPKIDGKLFVNHINGIKHDNRAENLEWCTPRENSLHANKVGLRNTPKGEKGGGAKLTREKVYEIKTRYAKKEGSLLSLSREFGVHKSTICNVVMERSWKHVTIHQGEE